MKTHKFARKPFYVDAVRVSEANMEEVAEWCGGTIVEALEGAEDASFISVKVYRPINDRQTQAYPGDWVLFAGTGYKVYTPKAFDKSFEKVKTLTKAQADAAGIKVPHEPRPPKRPVPTPPSNPVLSPKDVAAVTEKVNFDNLRASDEVLNANPSATVTEKDEVEQFIAEALK